jgi:hypothetical protein
LFIEFIDFTVRIVVFLAVHRGFWDGEGHYTSNSEVRASSWSNFTKKEIRKGSELSPFQNISIGNATNEDEEKGGG